MGVFILYMMALPLAWAQADQVLLQVVAGGALSHRVALQSSDEDAESTTPAGPRLGAPGVDVADRSFLGKGYNTMDTDLWTFENVYPTEFYRLDVSEDCFRQRMCSHAEIVETNFFDSVAEFTRSFYSSFGIELSGKFMGIEGSLSASIEKSMAQHGQRTKAILEIRMYKRSGCYQMRGQCAYDPGSLNPKVLEVLSSLPVDSDNASSMAAWEDSFIKRFGTHVSLGSEHGAQVRAVATSSSNQQGMQHFLKNALKAEISLEWGEHVGGSFGVESKDEEDNSRSLAETSYSVRCASIGGNASAMSPCIKFDESGTDTQASTVERRLMDFFTPDDVDDGKSVFSMYLKDMADVFNHMGYSNYSWAMAKAAEYHRCKAPFKWAPNAEGRSTCQCALECKNGGKLDADSCSCSCPADEFHGWTGADCSRPFGSCQVGANSGNQGAARKCAVDNTCASPVWKAACHSTEVCCLTHFKGACCPFGHTCDCNVNSCKCKPPPDASFLQSPANFTA
jgi:hypothetical protein